MTALAMTTYDAPPPPSTGAAGLTIDELAASTRLPSRTIRFYQSKGALMPPEIRGRVAFYGQPHVERLKLIAQLQDRGLRIDAIGDLLKKIDRGELDLAEWLGVKEQSVYMARTRKRPDGSPVWPDEDINILGRKMWTFARVALHRATAPGRGWNLRGEIREGAK